MKLIDLKIKRRREKRTEINAKNDYNIFSK